MKQTTTPLQQQQMLRTQASLEDHTLGQRRLSDQSSKSNTSPTGNTARVKPRPSPLFGTENASPAQQQPQQQQHSYQQHVPVPLQAVPTYNSSGNSFVEATPPLPQQQGGLQMPRDTSHSTMEYSEISPQHNRVSENEPSHNDNL